MKKIITVLLCLTLLLGLSACGGDAPETTQPTETQSTEPAVTQVYYSLYSSEYNGTLMEADELQDLLLSQGFPADEMYIMLRSDGTGQVDFMGNFSDICYDDTAYWPVDAPEERTEYTLEGNLLTIQVDEAIYTFEH